MNTPIVKVVRVPVDPDRAFSVFTQGIARWWPGESHSVSASQHATPQDIVIEPRVGGSIYEITHQGARADWGKVLDWQDGVRLVFTWHPGAEPSHATQVEVTFQAIERWTEVTLTHTGWDQLGTEGVAGRAGYDSGWDFVLGTCFCAAF